MSVNPVLNDPVVMQILGAAVPRDPISGQSSSNSQFGGDRNTIIANSLLSGLSSGGILSDIMGGSGAGLGGGAVSNSPSTSVLNSLFAANPKQPTPTSPVDAEGTPTAGATPAAGGTAATPPAQDSDPLKASINVLNNKRSDLVIEKAKAKKDDDKKKIQNQIEDVDKSIKDLSKQVAATPKQDKPAAATPPAADATQNANDPAAVPSNKSADGAAALPPGLQDLLKQFTAGSGGLSPTIDVAGMMGLNVGTGNQISDIDTFGPLGQVVGSMKRQESMFASLIPSLLGGGDASASGGNLDSSGLGALGLGNTVLGQLASSKSGGGVLGGSLLGGASGGGSSNPLLSNLFVGGGGGGILDSLGISGLVNDITSGKLTGKASGAGGASPLGSLNSQIFQNALGAQGLGGQGQI